MLFNDIFVFSKTIEQCKDDVLAAPKDALNIVLTLVRTSAFMLYKKIEFLSLKIRDVQIILQKNIYSKKIENLLENIEDKQQLERFFECLIYYSDFIED